MLDLFVRVVCERECVKTQAIEARRVFMGISWEDLTRETLVKTSCLHPVLTLRIPVMCGAYASLCGMLTRELPTKTFQSLICLESSHSLSHTHNPYK